MRHASSAARLAILVAAALSAAGCVTPPSTSPPTGAAPTSLATDDATPTSAATPGATIVVPSAVAVAHHANQVSVELTGAPPMVRLLEAGTDAGEPTVGILADGRIAYQGWDHPSGSVGSAVVSLIDPATGSSSVVLPAGTINSHDPYLWVDPETNRIFSSHLQVPGELDPTQFCVVVTFSDDAGATWQDSERRCQATPEDRPRIITGDPVSSTTDGYPNLVYLCFQDDEAERGQLCAVSRNGGLSFDMPTAEAFAFDGRCNSSFGQPAIGPDGSLWLVTAGCHQVKVAVSRDEARSWVVLEPGGPDTNGDGEAGVAVDRDGTVYVVWTAIDRLPRLVSSTDQGATWGAPVNVAAPGVKETNLATLQVGGPGKLAIGYVGSLDAPGGPQDPGSTECAFQPCPDLLAWQHATWHAWLTVTENALDDAPLFVSAVLNDPTKPIVRGNCGPGRCKSLADFLDVAIDGAGSPMLTFVACPDGLCPTTPLRGAWASAPGMLGILEGPDLR